mgnify:CR=1 FL=1|tara:strand:+ start:147 stop:770 length:624 start_codon:yes stop_codon:yes gene_type:complete
MDDPFDFVPLNTNIDTQEYITLDPYKWGLQGLPKIKITRPGNIKTISFYAEPIDGNDGNDGYIFEMPFVKLISSMVAANTPARDINEVFEDLESEFNELKRTQRTQRTQISIGSFNNKKFQINNTNSYGIIKHKMNKQIVSSDSHAERESLFKLTNKEKQKTMREHSLDGGKRIRPTKRRHTKRRPTKRRHTKRRRPTKRRRHTKRR